MRRHTDALAAAEVANDLALEFPLRVRGLEKALVPVTLRVVVEFGIRARHFETQPPQLAAGSDFPAGVELHPADSTIPPIAQTNFTIRMEYPR